LQRDKQMRDERQAADQELQFGLQGVADGVVGKINDCTPR
jgi:hypothetical protein